MRDEVVRLRSKINDLRDKRSTARERDTVIADLRSLIDCRNQALDVMEERTRIQLHSNEVTVSIVSLRREFDEAKAGALTARASEEAARLQLARMMDKQLAQNQTIDTLRRQVESSNNSAQQAQALLRANQEQHSRSRCVLCMAGMRWIHQDRSHRDKIYRRWVPPHGGRAVSILIRT